MAVRSPNAETTTEDNTIGDSTCSLTADSRVVVANNDDAATTKSDPSLIQSVRVSEVYNKHKDSEWHRRFESPAKFKQQLYNEAGQTLGTT